MASSLTLMSNVKSVAKWSIVKMEENRFGLNRGRMTSVGTKVNSTSQNILACKISRIFVHWGPFYGTFCGSSLTLLPPFDFFVDNYLVTIKIFDLACGHPYQPNTPNELQGVSQNDKITT